MWNQLQYTYGTLNAWNGGVVYQRSLYRLASTYALFSLETTLPLSRTNRLARSLQCSKHKYKGSHCSHQPSEGAQFFPRRLLADASGYGKSFSFGRRWDRSSIISLPLDCARRSVMWAHADEKPLITMRSSREMYVRVVWRASIPSWILFFRQNQRPTEHAEQIAVRAS